jgi:hypothetical protein
MVVVGALCLAASLWLVLSSSQEIMNGEVAKGGLFGLSLGVLVVVGLLLLCSGLIMGTGAEGRRRGQTLTLTSRIRAACRLGDLSSLPFQVARYRGSTSSATGLRETT